MRLFKAVVSAAPLTTDKSFEMTKLSMFTFKVLDCPFKEVTVSCSWHYTKYVFQ